jgi:hypothetical protein
MKTSIQFPNTAELDRFETAAGTEIHNSQDYSVMENGDVQSKCAAFQAQFGSATPRTKVPTGIYNCHGLVFACGRTGIYQPSEVRAILNDDGYVKVDPADALPGDVVLYVAEDGDVEHSALLITAAHKSDSGWPMVVSKWGNFTEFFHPLRACPYPSPHIEYWRIEERPRTPVVKSLCLIHP